MLGSLMVYLFTGATLQSLVDSKIPGPFRTDQWSGAFDQDLIAVLDDAHAKVLAEHLLPHLAPEVADVVMELARNLTRPDPARRGDPKARRQVGRPVGMDRVYDKLRAAALTCNAVERGRGKAKG